ncbi:FadR/GntR family transcriptional regulator [Marinovum sp.]|uniref:FadR/GntR family transcriptional regulator n=1 Tax=Marinovum sp. TaxID=2024839 RepID=UPI002B274CD3|nr:FadR/GntR family transcriptional regulator [Marinovum sp.]
MAEVKQRGQGGPREIVTSTLARMILSGEIAPGERLPTEDALRQKMDVSRTALRESVRMLAGKGLIESRPRIGTVVLPATRWNHLDGDILAWRETLPPDLVFIRSLTEARQVIEPAAAEMAAQRADGSDLGRMQEAYQRMSAARDDDIDAIVAADEAFHFAILLASKNEIFANFGTVIGAALRMSFRMTTQASENFADSLHTHGDVLEAIRMRESETARRLMAGLIGVAARDLGRAASQRGQDTAGAL